MKSNSEINYLFVRYIQQSIRNTSNAFLKKKHTYSNNYFSTDILEDLIVNNSYDQYLLLDSITESEINILQNFTENEKLSKAIERLSFKEKKLIYEKYIQCKTDNEIATSFSISRQGVSIYKKRVLKKLEEFLKR